MIQTSIALPSGRSEAFTLPQSSKVGDLRILAQKSFQRGFLRLVDADHGDGGSCSVSAICRT